MEGVNGAGPGKVRARLNDALGVMKRELRDPEPIFSIDGTEPLNAVAGEMVVSFLLPMFKIWTKVAVFTAGVGYEHRAVLQRYALALGVLALPLIVYLAWIVQRDFIRAQSA